MKQNELTNIAYIRELSEKYGFSNSKSFGQNFIVNPGICPRIAQEAGIDKDTNVLEIGPGFGVLTRELARCGAKVAAVEIDDRLPPLLAETLADFSNVEIVSGDVLKLDLHALLKETFSEGRTVVCANLPYYITSPILMKLLEERLPVESITVMVQREAAQRLTAAEGSRASGAISLAVRYYAEAEKLFDVQPGSFYPPPKVVSSVIRLLPRKTPPVSPKSEKALFRTIRAGFSQRRKTAANAVSAGTGRPKEAVREALCALGLSENVRPEQMSLQNFSDLSDLLFEGGAG